MDDIGMLPVQAEAAEAFYRIIDAAYERRSIAVTSNIRPSDFDTIMPKTIATAAVDRLLHHAHLVLTSGDSHRLAQALAGKGVVRWPGRDPAGTPRPPTRTSVGTGLDFRCPPASPSAVRTARSLRGR
ncbi:MAG TPA: ATP-binding protein [Actinocrinis sp.]